MMRYLYAAILCLSLILLVGPAGAVQTSSITSPIPAEWKIEVPDGVTAVQVKSEALTIREMDLLSKEVARLNEDASVKGIVVAMQPYTLPETSYYASLTIANEKPIIFVPVSGGTKGDIQTAMNIAASRQTPAGTLAMNGGDAVFARDIHLKGIEPPEFSDFSGDFFTEHGPVLSAATTQYRFMRPRQGKNSEFVTPSEEPLPRIDIIYAYAETPREVIEASVKSGAKGIVLACSTNGTMNKEADAYINGLSDIPVVVASAYSGDSAPRLPAGSRRIYANALSPGKAKVLLTLAMQREYEMDEIKRVFIEYGSLGVNFPYFDSRRF